MISRLAKTLLAFILGWTSGLIACLGNQLPLGNALLRSLGFGILVAVIVAVLAWASETAEQKGYPGWLGFWLVVILNILGILIIWLLPERKAINGA
jgi:ABC-type transport system involved in cytochrome c biogenesis permease subunit